MSAGCRHCFPDPGPGQETYLTVMKHGNIEGLRRRLLEIEADGEVVAGVTVWCEVCHRVSVVSYSLYEYLHNQDLMSPQTGGAMQCTSGADVLDPGMQCMSISDYYSSLCTRLDKMRAAFGK